jgi:lipopolysaccharide/colanic/teichoic acid biosynthesis glycosyltransferase
MSLSTAGVSLGGQESLQITPQGKDLPLVAMDPIASTTRLSRSPRPASRPRLAIIPREGVRVIRRDYYVAKRAMDIAICLAVVPAALAVMAFCGVLVWIDDPGPVVFVQNRTGRGGRRFRMYKFRTMLKNAEQLKEKYAHLNELTPPDFKITNDPRMTRVGRLLRKTSLDELPQIFNVLKGEMSLVGPRPTSFDSSTYALWQMERLEVPPGITGLWQVSGRSDVDFTERLALDIDYIERQSLRLDFEILVRTVAVLFSRRGAY